MLMSISGLVRGSQLGGRTRKASVQQLLAMGGYGAYVWAAFGITAAIMAGLFWQSGRAARKEVVAFERLREQQRAQAPRRRRPLVAERPTEPAGDGPKA
jgi:heme exporter protein CcmD